jgi:hypothetical protein
MKHLFISVVRFRRLFKKTSWSLLFLFLLISNSARAQGFDKVAENMWAQAGNTYKLLSVFVLLAGLFFLGKGVIEGLRGEQGAWAKIGGSLLVFAVWFFAVPPLINFLSAQAKTPSFTPF